jgi:uncharacterized protein YceK
MTRANKRGAGKGGIAVLWRAGRAWPALPDRKRWQRDTLKTTARIIFLSLICICGGCATYLTRISAGERAKEVPPVYPATYLDGTLMSAPFQKKVLGGSAVRSAGICVLGVVDLPVSLAFDTLLLPYDAISSAAEGKEAAQPDGAANRSQPIHSETNQPSGAAGPAR